jgi:calcium-dependent protein kinase
MTSSGGSFTALDLRKICERGFNFVDSVNVHYIDLAQSRTALQFVFSRLSVPAPRSESWYHQVFANFDKDKDGLIHFNEFFEIAGQYYAYHLNKNNVISVTSDDSEVASAQKRLLSITTQSTINIRKDVLVPENRGRLAIFDNYDFLEKAGEGSFGKVLVVKHKMTNQFRACKAVSNHSKTHVSLINNEIEALTKLDHPNILRLFETYHDGSNVYLITELCQGGPLFDRILFHYEKLKEPMTEGQVAMYMHQILSGIGYCHKVGIVLRDCKPENIMFLDRSRDSPIKLIDFGLACSLQKLEETAKEVKIPRKGFMGAVARALPSLPNGKNVVKKHERVRHMPRAGTASYMSPEMLNGQYNEKTDLFSAGIVLYQLLTGVHPFCVRGKDNEETVKQNILKNDVKFSEDLWSNLTGEAKSLVQQLLEKSPTKRIAAKDALRHPWFSDPEKPTLHGHNSQLTVSVFDGLKQYQSSSKLKRLVLKLLARELNDFQISGLRKKFLALDKEGRGFITFEDLKVGVKDLGLVIQDGDLELLVNTVGCGTEIGYNDFVAALIEKRLIFDKDQMKAVFNRLDIRNEGKLSIEGLKEVLVGEEFDQDEIADMFLEVQSGMDFHKFCDLIR